MITFTPLVEAPSPAPRPRRLSEPSSRSGAARAFTLAELIVSTGLSSILLAGILSTFLLLLRIGQNASAYTEMNGNLRIAVERFHHDVRLASDVRWTSPRSLTLVLPASLEREVAYRYDPPTRLNPSGRFIRQPAGRTAETLVNNVAEDFTFRRYRLPAGDGSEVQATNDLETRLLEVSLRSIRPGANNPAASQFSLSARCVLRNKSPGS